MIMSMIMIMIMIKIMIMTMCKYIPYTGWGWHSTPE